MKLCNKTFLFAVGILTLSMEEVNKAMQEAVEAVDKQSQKVKKSVSKKIT